MNPTIRSSPHAVRRLLLIGAVIGGVAASAVSAVGGFDARSDASDSRADRDAAELLQLRSELRRAFIAEPNELMLVALGEGSETELARLRAERIRVVQTVRDRTDALSQGTGPSAAEALVLTDALRRDELTETEVDPGILFEGSWFVTVAGERPEGHAPPEHVALADLAALDSIGGLVLNDALDAAYVMMQPTVPDLLDDYVGRSEQYIRSDGGYLGSDASDPLTDAWVFRDRAPQPHPGVADVNARVAESALWEYDRWIQSWQDVDPDAQPGPPPLALDELVAETAVVDADLQAIVDARLESAYAAQDRAVSASLRTSVILFALAALLALAVVGLVVVVLVQRLRAVRHRADQIARDPLTGAGNRLQLDHVAALMHRSGADQHHAVIAVDLDRFKLVNDSLGHAAGDRVLITVAHRLADLVERWSRRSPGASGTVIRMGGDEFLCVLHTASPIDEAHLRRDLDAIRGDSIDVDEHAVQLRFSLGLAVSRGACDLNALLSAADLAAYEDKAVRARAFAPVEPPAPAPARR